MRVGEQGSLTKVAAAVVKQAVSATAGVQAGRAGVCGGGGGRGGCSQAQASPPCLSPPWPPPPHHLGWGSGSVGGPERGLQWSQGAEAPPPEAAAAAGTSPGPVSAPGRGRNVLEGARTQTQCRGWAPAGGPGGRGAGMWHAREPLNSMGQPPGSDPNPGLP